MASEAQVDLIISTQNTLPELESDLQRIIEAAEAGADPVDIEVAMDRREAVATLLDDVTDAISALNTLVPEVEVQAALDLHETLENLIDDLDTAVALGEAQAQQIQLDAELDADIAALDAEIAALVAELEASAPEVDIDVDVDRDGSGGRALQNLTRLMGPLGGAVGSVVPKLGALGAAAGSAAPLIAGLVTAVESVAPAAAVAVPGLLALTLATNTVKLAMIGVGDAVKTAFDPEAKPEELEKSLQNLAPHARKFVEELREMRSWLSRVQKDVQNRFFEGFDRSLEELSVTVFPDVIESLQRTSSLFNSMGRDVASTAAQLSRDGTLGIALKGAETGLSNLSLIPGQITKGLGQIAAAAAPAFTRITAAAGTAATKISERLDKAFESGALEKAIDKAVDNLAQLGRVVGNIFGGLGNIIEGFTQSGAGLFSTLEKITQAFEDVTATKGFQDALGALSKTMAVLVDTLLPLFTQALGIVGPVIETLAPPIQEIIKLLGPILSRILDALRPVLQAVATAFGKLLVALSPLITLAGNLITAILPVLTPLFDALGQALALLTPFIQQLAENVAAQLLPVLTVLARDVLPAILPPFIEMAGKILPLLTKVLVDLSPALIAMGQALANVLVAILPVIAKVLELQSAFLDELLPAIAPVIEWLTKLVTGGLLIVTNFINGVVVPAIQFLSALLRGDFSQAWDIARDAVKRASEKIRDYVQGLLEGLVGDLRTLPARAQEALAGIGTALYQKGRDLVQGLIDGVLSQISALASTVARLADTVTGGLAGALDIHSPSRVLREMGRDTMDGYLLGLKDGLPDLANQIQALGSMVPSFALPNGQALALPQQGQQTPVVQVFLGNERLDQHFDTRIALAERDRARLMTQGVRR